MVFSFLDLSKVPEMPPKSPAAGRQPRIRKSAGQGGSTSVKQEPTSAPPPTTDLVQLAGQIPAELLQQLAAALQSGHWLFAVWHVGAGTIHLDRTAADFPTADLDRAVSLLAENLQPLKGTP